ncbi:unnamed protein product [Gadus morhua 'NCC']
MAKVVYPMARLNKSCIAGLWEFKECWGDTGPSQLMTHVWPPITTLLNPRATEEYSRPALSQSCLYHKPMTCH